MGMVIMCVLLFCIILGCAVWLATNSPGWGRGMRLFIAILVGVMGMFVFPIMLGFDVVGVLVRLMNSLAFAVVIVGGWKFLTSVFCHDSEDKKGGAE
ncbi:MAG: hypothetical protein HRT87_10065 [Legionellales bacterium]|nr:hypothetical protein [Legionellales bacterium]